MAADKLVWLFNRLRRMSVAEMAWRLTSMSKQVADDVRIRLSLLPLPAETSLANRGFQVPKPTRLDLESLDLAVDPVARLRSKAEAVVANRMTFFDQADLHMGSPPDWHYDWHNKVSSQRKLSSAVDYRDITRNGDCKHVWEPNRHHQLVVLGRAYQVFGDQAYASKVFALLDHWCDENPYGYGMNWRSPMELGIRLVNWVWALDLVRSVPMDAALEQKLAQALYLMCWDVERKLSQGSSANNHVIGEAAGLYVAGRYFPSLIPEAWTSKAHKVLEEEVTNQYSDDGATLEQAFSYQLFVLQLFSVAALAGDWSTDPFSNTFWGQLARMYGYACKVASLGSPLPMYGDQDDGYVLDLGEHQHDAVQYQSVAAAMFGGPPIASEAVLWLRPQSRKTFSCTHTFHGLHVSEQAGVVLVNQTREDGVRLGLLFDCGPLGYGSLAAHGHADALQIVLYLNGEELLIDPGTFDYYSHPQLRDALRGTRAHNTICIDGADQSEIQGRFMWGSRASVRLISVLETDATIAMCAEVEGLWGLPGSSIRRAIEIDKTSLQIQITDEMFNLAGHEAAFNMHIPADVLSDVVADTLSFSSAAYDGSIHFDGIDELVVSTNDLSIRSLSYHCLQPIHEFSARRLLASASERMVSTIEPGIKQPR